MALKVMTQCRGVIAEINGPDQMILLGCDHLVGADLKVDLLLAEMGSTGAEGTALCAGTALGKHCVMKVQLGLSLTEK